MFSRLNRSALVVASLEARAKRRKRSVSRWRAHFKIFSLSSSWQECAIVESVVDMFRASADSTRLLRAGSGSQFVGAGHRQLRLEKLELRQMLSANTGALCPSHDAVGVTTKDISVASANFIPFVASSGSTTSVTSRLHPVLNVVVPSTPDLDTASDTGSSTTDNNTNDNTPTFNGASDVNSQVKVGVWVDGNNDNLTDDSEVSSIIEVTADGSGNYSATLATLADGNYKVVAKAYDEIGNPSEGSNNGWSNPLSIVIDTNILATTIDLPTASDSVSPNTILPGTDTDDLTNNKTPVIQGTAEPGTTIEVFDGTNPVPIATAAADETGNWVTSPLAIDLADGVHSVTATATDSFGNLSTSVPLLVTIDTIISSNTAPVMTTATDSGSSSNDNITKNNMPTFTGMTDDDAPNNAYVELLLDGATVIATGNASSGAWMLTPAVAISDGTHTIQSRITDRTGNVSTSASTTIVIDTVSPNAVDDPAVTIEDTPVTVDVIVNDSDTTDLSLTVTATTNGANGAVTTNGTTVTYTPNLNFNGTDSFTYTVTDDAGNSSTAMVNVTVNAVNDAPDAVNDTAATDEDTPVTTGNALANDTDVDNSLTSASIISFSQGTHGTVANNGNGTFTYTPNPNFNGSDSFTYTISDGTSSDTATVSVTVNPIDDAPDAVNDSGTTNEDTPVTTGNVLANDTDIDSSLTPASITSFTQGTNGTVVNNGNGTFTYTPNNNFNGADSFTYTISDGNSSDTATINITVTAVNDAPDAVNDTASTSEDTPVTTNNVLANDTDVDSTLTSASITAFTQGANGSVVSNGNGTFTYTPNSNFNGSDSFTYTISDGASSDTATVTIAVTAVNDAPDAVNDAASTNEDTPITISVLTNDNGGPPNEVQTVTVTATTHGAHGTVTTNGTAVTYTPNLNFYGADSFTYTITDGGGLTDTATVNVTVNPSVVVIGPNSANDGQTLTYSFTTSDPIGVSPFTRTITSSNPLDVVTPVSFNPTSGSGTFTVKFHGPVGTSTSILTVNVKDANGAQTGSNSLAVTVNSTFRVTGIVVNDSGFDFTFNNAIDFTNLNLYDGINPLLPSDVFKQPDVVVHAAIANVDLKGSVVWNAATNTLSWVRTGGAMSPDTYAIKLVSGANAFKDISGNLLDGNGNFVAGDNYQQSVPIGVLGGTPTVSLPDFARGPGQEVDLTAANTIDTTLPVRVTGVNVQGVDFKLVYDTRLLTIDPDQVTAAMLNWSVAASQSTVGTIATLIVSASANLPSAAFSGNSTFVNIVATVPNTAPYGATQVLRLLDSAVNEVNALNDNAIQKVAFPGDANGSGTLPLSSPPSAYTAEDASMIARVIVGAMGTTGFDAYPLVDPAIVGDASGNGGASLSAFDTSLIAQESAGINTPEVPDGVALGTGGFAQFDPQLSIPVGSSRVDLQACKLEYSIVSPK